MIGDFQCGMDYLINPDKIAIIVVYLQEYAVVTVSSTLLSSAYDCASCIA